MPARLTCRVCNERGAGIAHALRSRVNFREQRLVAAGEKRDIRFSRFRDHRAKGIGMGEVRYLIREHIPALRRYARALLRDRDQADDLVQDCLVRAINAADQWEPGTNLRAWLFAILHNIYVSDRRKLARRPRHVAMDTEESRLEYLPNQVKSVELSELERAIRSLPEQQRITVLLVGLQGMDYKEVAEITGVPLGTVRSRLSRAREALHRLLNESQTASAGEIHATKKEVS